MPSPIQAAGATVNPKNSAPLTMSRYITGIWTQRSPLRDAATTYLYEKNYSATRFDSLLDGRNIETTIRLTLGRSPGSTIYNSQIFPAIRRISNFKTLVDGDEDIRVTLDSDSIFYDGTGPSRQLSIWMKTPGAGRTYSQQVGNTLYFSNGIDAKKWIVSSFTWKPLTDYSAGDIVIDPTNTAIGYNNLQMAVGSFVVAVTGIAISGNVLTVSLDANDDDLPFNLNFMAGVSVTLNGLTAASFLNGQTVQIATTSPNGGGASIFTASFVHADYSSTPDTGSITSGSGTSGAAQPVWNSTLTGITIDGGVQWINRGPWVTNWGIIAPPKAPTVAQQPLVQQYASWAKNTYYSTSYLLYNSANHIQKVAIFGTTSSVEPVWNNSGGTTVDNTVTWQDQGLGTYLPSTAYAYGSYIMAADVTGKLYFFQAASSGTSGAAAPVFNGALGSKVTDNDILWVNIGIAQQWTTITASSVSSGFAIIPVLGGGSVAVGTGTGANGSLIALPAGYTTANLLAWTTAGRGVSPSIQLSGVLQSTGAGGLLNSSMQNRSNGFAFTVDSNWAAATWTAGAAVTLTTVGAYTYLTFTTALGDDLSIVLGQAPNGANVTVPPGFLPFQFVGIAGMATTNATGNGLQCINTCGLDSGLHLSAVYRDGSLNTWTGNANVFGIFWKTGGGVSTQGVTNGTAIIVPTVGAQSVTFIQAVVPNGLTFSTPPGYGNLTATASMNSQLGPAGSSVAHGIAVCGCTATTFNGLYQDGSAFTWGSSGNVFAVAATLAATVVSPDRIIDDGNGSLQSISMSGLSGPSAPAWRSTRGSITVDNLAKWTNYSAFAAASTAEWTWGYGYRSLVDGSVSTTSQQSQGITLNAGNEVLMQGFYSSDVQVGSVVIYRTVQGGSVLLYEDEIPNIVGNGTWTYSDRSTDKDLNAFIVAPIAHRNDPPPKGFRPSAYHLGRIWGFVGNVLTYSSGPDTTFGNGNTAFAPLNTFPVTSSGTRVWSTSIGLISLTNADAWITLGLGTSASSFSTIMFQEGIGLGDYDQFCVQGSTAYMKTTARRVVSWDPGAGEIEVGLPIGDQFDKYPKVGGYLTFHDGSSEDVALYVSDGTAGWFRMSALAAPEQGSVWSPYRGIVGGTSAIRSVDIEPGERRLLMGPMVSGPILQRDYATYADNTVPYPAWATIGSIVVAQPGSSADIEFITLEAMKIGSPPSVEILLGEFSGYANSPPWTKLQKTANDPTLQAPATTLYSTRHHMAQVQQNQSCRHLQLRISWPTENFANELLSHTIYGSLN